MNFCNKSVSSFTIVTATCPNITPISPKIIFLSDEIWQNESGPFIIWIRLEYYIDGGVILRGSVEVCWYEIRDKVNLSNNWPSEKRRDVPEMYYLERLGKRGNSGRQCGYYWAESSIRDIIASCTYLTFILRAKNYFTLWGSVSLTDCD